MIKNLFHGLPRKIGKPLDLRSINRDIGWRRKIASEQKKIADRFLLHTNTVLNCPICSSGLSAEYVCIHGYLYKSCTICSHIYLSNLPNKQTLIDLYTDGVNVQHSIYLNNELFDKRLQNIALPKVQYLNSVINAAGTWIDVGCGTGEILQAASSIGYKAIGLETDQGQVDFGRKLGLNIVCERFSRENGSRLLKECKIISLFNVLEHVEDPIDFLSLISSNLPEEAFLVVEVPRTPSLSTFANLCFPDLAARHIYPPDHLHIFSEESLSKALENSGLVPISIWLFGQDIQELLISCAAQSAHIDSGIFEKLLDISPKLQEIIDENSLADTMIVIAKKA